MSDWRSLTVKLCHLAAHCLWYLEDVWSTLARGEGEGLESSRENSLREGRIVLNLEKGEGSSNDGDAGFPTEILSGVEIPLDVIVLKELDL